MELWLLPLHLSCIGKAKHIINHIFQLLAATCVCVLEEQLARTSFVAIGACCLNQEIICAGSKFFVVTFEEWMLLNIISFSTT